MMVMSSSGNVIKDIKIHTQSVQDQSNIMWEILHSNIVQSNQRKIIEAIEIRKHLNIMNGCIGRTLDF